MTVRLQILPCCALQFSRVFAHGSGATDESHLSVFSTALLLVTMASAEQTMEMIRITVAAAVAEALKQLNCASPGVGGEDGKRSGVDTVVKRTEKFGGNGSQGLEVQDCDGDERELWEASRFHGVGGGPGVAH